MFITFARALKFVAAAFEPNITFAYETCLLFFASVTPCCNILILFPYGLKNITSKTVGDPRTFASSVHITPQKEAEEEHLLSLPFLLYAFLSSL